MKLNKFFFLFLILILIFHLFFFQLKKLNKKDINPIV